VQLRGRIARDDDGGGGDGGSGGDGDGDEGDANLQQRGGDAFRNIRG